MKQSKATVIQEDHIAEIEYAEQQIANKGTVVNTNLGDSSLILQLFKKHGIVIPTKTKQWIINSLKSMDYHVDEKLWYHWFKGKESRAFPGYFFKLEELIQKKMQQPE